MHKIISLTIVVAIVLGGLAFGAERFLSVDDLAQCARPDPLVSACTPADAVVSISGGDTQARAAEAIKLYQAGWAPKLIFSGAALDTSGPSNAEAMRAQAVKAGVPQNAIGLDTTSLNTIGNARNTSTLLLSATRVVLVTSPYHQRRADIEFTRFFGKRVTIINHPTSTDRYWPQYWYLTLTGWSLALQESIKTAFVMVAGQ